MPKFYQKRGLFLKPLQAWAPGTTSYQWLFQWCVRSRPGGELIPLLTKRWSKTQETKKTSWSKRPFFVRVFWCLSIVQSGILSWMNYHGVTWPQRCYAFIKCPKNTFPLNFTITWLMTYGRPRLQLTLAYPSRHCGHRGHCGHHIEGGQKGCYVRWIMKIPKLKIPWFRFQGWLVSRQERPHH